MKLSKTAFLLGCTLFLGPVSVTAGAPSETVRVDNFVLLDHRGKARELYYQSDAEAVVLMTQANGCRAVHSQLAGYQALADQYTERGARFFMINSSPEDSRAEIVAEAEEAGIQIPVLHDSAQLVGRSLELTQTTEVLVIDTSNWELVYRGGMDDSAGKTRVSATLDALLAGQAVAYSAGEADGCLVNYPASDVEISYARTIAPILEKNCVHCHSEGGIAPWAMSDYRMVQGFAPMMREVVRTKRMPPWHADPAVGKWQHDAGISDEDASLLVQWIESGAPRGEGEDPLLAIKPVENKWTLGEPDLIIEIPAYDIPATGVIDYQFPFVNNPLDHDVWVVAATIIPGDTQAVHHVLMGSADQPPGENDREGVFQNYIMGYAPGNESAYMPEGTGVYVPVGGVYLFQMHYTPYGKATTDKTRVGLYFAKPDQPPQNFLRQQVVLNPKISIPPKEAAHEESAYFEFWDDAVIYSLVPHSHYRGRSSTFELAYPDGSTELILSVPNYDFNWQRTYAFTEPKSVPKGTRIIHRTVYDNSSRNPANPNPERTVPWGLQSHDEMLYGSVSFAWTNESVDAPMHSNMRADTAQWMGFMDRNMDGKVQRDEMSPRLRDSIGWKWYLLDRNFDGGLNLTEMERLMQSLTGP